MKWYTLEERPIKNGDEGLFRFDNDMAFGHMSIGDEKRGGRIFEKNDCHDHQEYWVDEIICWIPKDELDKAVNSYDFIMKRVYLSKEELKASLPKD